MEKPAPSFEPIRERLEEMEDRESLCTIFFSADARPEFQQLLEKFRKEKREFIWFCPVNRIIRPEINAGIRPYTRLIDVEEGGAVMKQNLQRILGVDRTLLNYAVVFASKLHSMH